MKTCSIDGCNKPIRCKGFCNSHYIKWRTKGSAESGRQFSNGAPLDWILANKDHQGADCVFWPFSKNNRGYGRIRYEGRSQLAHRIMAQFACERLDGTKTIVAHSCGGGHLGCVNPQHLRWASHAENEHDKLDHGTSNRGFQNGQAKFTEQQIIDIRRKREGGALLKTIAQEYGTTVQTISGIVNRYNWRHL